MDREETINRSIGNRILIFRKSNRMSKTKLARALGVTQQQLDKYEKGINRISAAKLAMIMDRFGVDASYFYPPSAGDGIANAGKQNHEGVDSLAAYFLNIKTSERKQLMLNLIRELANQ